jgi:hypothetical protein
MKLFYSSAGASNPSFVYKFKVKKCTTEMYEWASNYPEKGPFSRWYVEWNTMKMDSGKNYDVIQIEHSEAAKIFKIAFAGEYEDITMKEYRLD